MRKVVFTTSLLLSAFLATVLAAGAANEEGSALTVRVRDPQGRSIPGARVDLYRRDRASALATAATDREGTYQFHELGAGAYLVQASAAGFAPSKPIAVDVEPPDPAALTVSLALQGVEERVAVTASSTPQTVDEVSKALTSVDERELDERDEYAFHEALRNVPGVRVQQLGGPGAFTAVRLRGLRNEDTAVLIDGVRLRDATATQGDASGLVDGLVSTDLDRIEILRGSGSSLYGTHAIGGVINIVTKDGGGPPRGNLLLEGGSLDLFRGNAQTAGGIEADRLRYSVGLSRVDVGSGVDGDDRAENTSVQGRLDLRIAPTANLSARVYGAKTAAALNEDPLALSVRPGDAIVDAVPLEASELVRFEEGTPVSSLDLGDATFIPSANDPDNERRAHFVSTLLSLDHRPRPELGFTVRYHGLVSQRTFLDGPRGVAFEPQGTTRSDFEGFIHTLTGRVDAGWGSHSLLTAGYELERESFVNDNTPEDPALASAVDVSQSSHSFFVQEQLRSLGGALQISGAFRAQVFSLSEPVFTPRVSAPYRDIDFVSPPNAYTGDASFAYFLGRSGTKIRAHVGNGYRAPSLFERFGALFGSFGYSVFGDPRLQPERSTSFDVGLDQSFARDRLRASGTFFVTRLQDVIVFDFTGAIDPATDPFGRFGGYRRVEGGDTRGLELSVTATPESRLDLSASYSYVQADRPFGIDQDLPQAFVIPRHQFSLVATSRLTQDLYVSVDLAWTDGYLAPVFDPVSFTSRPYRFPGGARADVVGSYSWPLSSGTRLRFFGKVENLFDREAFESGFRTPGRVGVGGVAFDF